MNFGNIVIMMSKLAQSRETLRSWGNYYDLVRFYDPNNPFPEETLPEMYMDKRKETNNDSTNNEVDLKSVNQNINNFGLANSLKTGLIGYGGKTGELTKATGNYLKVFKVVGTAGTIINTGYAGVQLYNNPTAGNATRLVVQGLVIGTAFIPGVGWVISLGIGTADMIWGDQFYEWIDNP